MDIFEQQGTRAAELAGEDFAAQRRVRDPSHALPICHSSLHIAEFLPGAALPAFVDVQGHVFCPVALPIAHNAGGP